MLKLPKIELRDLAPLNEGKIISTKENLNEVAFAYLKSCQKFNQEVFNMEAKARLGTPL